MNNIRSNQLNFIITLLFAIACLLPWMASAQGFLNENQNEASIAAINTKIVKTICSGDTAWLSCFREDLFSCERIARPLVEQCVKQEFTMRVSKQTSQSGMAYLAKNIHPCLVKSFEQTLGKKRVNSDRCKNMRF